MPLSLNPKQSEAVQSDKKKCLVIAGAGSGKTAVITERIGYLLDSGVRPESILAITFTNKAANEMKDRVRKKVGNRIDHITIGTFHSVCARLLRAYGPRIGIKSNFTIADEQDSYEIMKTIYKTHYADKMSDDAIRTALSSIAFWINNCKEPDRTLELATIYDQYRDEMRKANVIDFNGLIANAVRLLETAPDIRFGHVLVDEFQDTNVIQMKLIDLLIRDTGNLFVVGDDAQTIYSWRFATIDNILNLSSAPDTAVYVLDQNYRCTSNILEAANSVISNNTKQITKNLWTDNTGGEKIGMIYSYDNYCEAEAIAEYISSHPVETAILCRTNSQMRDIETALVYSGIPHKIYSGQSIFSYKVVKDFIAYLKLIENSEDMFAFRRIVNFPKRGIGEKALSQIVAYMRDNEMSVMDMLGSHVQDIGLTKKPREELENFGKIIGAGSKVAYNIVDLTNFLLDNIAFVDPDKKEDLEVFEDFLQLIQSIYRENRIVPLSDFLAMCSLNDEEEHGDENVLVKLMTIHAAKGLEFDTVIMPGVEENIIPHIASMPNPAMLEEERRLFYVALTRAKKHAIVSLCSQRHLYGDVVVQCSPSRFLKEIPKELFVKL